MFKYGVLSGPYFTAMRENTDQKKLRIWTLSRSVKNLINLKTIFISYFRVKMLLFMNWNYLRSYFQDLYTNSSSCNITFLGRTARYAKVWFCEQLEILRFTPIKFKIHWVKKLCICTLLTLWLTSISYHWSKNTSYVATTLHPLM